MTITIGTSSTATLGFASPGLMVLGLAGGKIGQGIIDPILIPRNFAVRRGSEGPQIIVSWDAPSAVIDDVYEDTYTVQLERRTLDFSNKLNDSTILYSGTLSGSYSFSDYYPNIKKDISYYYTLYIKMPETITGYTGDDPGFFVTSPSLQKSAIALDTGFFNTKLYELLPGIFRKSDTFDNLSEAEKPLYVLESTTGTDELEGEKLNFKEDQGRRHGPLFRFLKLISLGFDEIRGLINYMTSIYNVDTCDIKFMEALASNYALKFKQGINVTRKRADLRNIVHFYKWKGSGEALESRAKALSTSNLVYTKEYNENTLLTNTNRTCGNSQYPIGIRNQNYTLLTSPYNNPNIMHRGPKSMLFNSFNGNVEDATNKYTNLSSADSLGQGFVFSEITNFGSITGLNPYNLLDSPGNYTIEGWLCFKKWPKPPSSGISSINILKRQVTISATVTYTIAVRLNTVRISGSDHIVRRLAFYVGSSSGTWVPIQLKEELGHIQLDTSFHFSFIRNSDNSPNPEYKLYLNGSLIGTDSSIAYTIPASTDLSSGTGFTFGDSSSGGLRDSLFQLDGFRVWNLVRSASDISDNYNKSISGQINGLVLNLDADYIKGTTAYETSSFGATTTLAKATNSVYNSLSDPLTSSLDKDNKWYYYNQQKHYQADNQYYVVGNPVSVNGVREYIYANNTDIQYPEVTV